MVWIGALATVSALAGCAKRRPPALEESEGEPPSQYDQSAYMHGGEPPVEGEDQEDFGQRATFEEVRGTQSGSPHVGG